VLAQEYLAGTVRAPWATPADAFVEEFGAYYDVPANRVRRFIRRTLGGSIHQWLYDAESLSLLLSDAGFVDVVSRGYREGQAPLLTLIEHRPRSLFVEARKPA
jgi:hypothetical protein